ncbi:acyl-CoA dehydrogenase family protein [Acidocella sp. KAb 2-4]|uniref:acyl-CoA dehydrogenase family protein n=1 Tax=Acidocella sp. KAb 2-4 TaxID=2885158 RepID=UPI001D08CC4E|nr:acyl-CoA dehydrogenase family protein [Acidocella sp. KAb 2-4]MCB5944350.1 acyl-CoA dehydrogenase family protein [Acidocella sp. KAb 2-4]
MPLTYTTSQQTFRQEARAWLAAHMPPAPLPHFDATRDGFEAHRAWERTLHAGGWSVVSWPKEYGGRGLDLIEWLIFEEEYYRAGAPGRVNQNGICLLAPTMMEYGTAEQKARFLPPMASGEEIWAQAWSEPQAGSDLAHIRATVTQEGDELVLNGHKIWSSRAVFADWAFGLFRTPGSERHRGMSLVFFPLNAPGVTVNAIRKMDGHVGFAELFLENVRVPVFNRLGEDGQGWHICMATAGFERGLLLRSPARYQQAAARLVALYHAQGAAADPVLGQEVARAWMNAEAYMLAIYAMCSRLLAGGKIGPEASTNKIFWSELDIHLHRTALALLGPRAELLPDAPEAAHDHDWLDGYVFSLAGPIYAGSNEIQRNIIAERMLGLPR